MMMIMWCDVIRLSVLEFDHDTGVDDMVCND
jgi:hypothetical protein